MDEASNQNLNQNKKESAVKSSFFFFSFFILALSAFDQLAKYFAPRIFKNNNFAFSLPLPTAVMYGIYFVVLGLMLYYAAKNYQKFTAGSKLAWALIFAGALSNIIERIVLGYVRDWIYIFNGVFNLADSYIIVGVIILLFSKRITNL